MLDIVPTRQVFRHVTGRWSWIAGSCAAYRAAASTDLADDDESFAAGQKIGCPLLVLWLTVRDVGGNAAG